MFHFNTASSRLGATAVLVVFTWAWQAQSAEQSRFEPVCVDLSKYYTAQLDDSLNSPNHVQENNLASLPQGRQVMLGVPFQIGGVLQLSGKKIQQWGRNEFPQAITNIAVGRLFSQLQLLHGAGGVFDSDGAKLVLHYADQSTREIEIKNGVHVRDWWGDPNQRITGTDSALAWTGTNPALKKYGDAGTLRLYKSAFKNPQKDIVVTSIDFQSAMQNSSPFIVGLTVQ